MNENIPSPQEVKGYLDRRFGQESMQINFIRKESRVEDLPDIHVPIHIGNLLFLLAKIQSSKRILEIGTLGGYSAAWLAKGLAANGSLISLEINPEYAKKAREHLEKIQEKRVEIRVGHAVELLSQMAADDEEPFDLIFIDADKENNVLYLDWSIRLSRPGTLILIDNLIPKGVKVGYPSHRQAKEIYAFNDYLACHPSLETVVIPMLVGDDGRLDGLALARVIQTL